VRVCLRVAYDGAPFAGWQSQPGGDTVQDALEKALEKISGEPVRVHGAGRTDAGVHAEGQVCHFDSPSRGLPPEEWLRALNARLPGTVRVLSAARAAENFHARFSAHAKVYRYRLVTSEVLPPALYRRAWHVRELPARPLQKAASLFVGSHDFTAFSANRGRPVRDSCRTIHSAELQPVPYGFDLTIRGDGFLYKMVRMLVGACVRHARGLVTLEELADRLAAGGPRWNFVAPADGLCLVDVEYGEALADC
jgi:tRNA pseudouridine38-40 synthase